MQYIRLTRGKAAPIIAAVTSFFAKLDHRATLVLAGPDARHFLQGQVTCDVDALSEKHSPAGACCTPQGRMICDFRLLQDQPDRLLLLLESDLVEAALASFRKYIVFSKAEIEDASGNLAQFALWGQGALALAGATSSKVGASWRAGDIIWTVVDDAGAMEACLPAAQADGLAERLASAATPVEAGDWRRHEIDRGVGHVRGPTVEMFLPQMLNYQLTGRVSFSKGCYTGQEVVARMHYRGKVKRAMVLAHAESGAPGPGDSLYRAASPQAVGNVVSAEPAPGGGVKLLVVLALDALDGAVHLGEEGPRLSFLPMPYSLEAGEPG